MRITTILFDLDGTLLPMDEKVFVKAYFGLLSKKLSGIGYEPETLINAVWTGTASMVKNTGKYTNEEVFWMEFEKIFGDRIHQDKEYFDEFYHNEFMQVKEACGYNSKARVLIDLVKELGFRVVCATNPIFPALATENRMRFAGLSPDDFEYYTTYENSHYCKPNPDYYKEILEKINCTPEECIMVGNDAREDMVAGELGMKVFLLKDCLINKDDVDISQYPQGDFDDLINYIKNINI